MGTPGGREGGQGGWKAVKGVLLSWSPGALQGTRQYASQVVLRR